MPNARVTRAAPSRDLDLGAVGFELGGLGCGDEQVAGLEHGPLAP